VSEYPPLNIESAPFHEGAAHFSFRVPEVRKTTCFYETVLGADILLETPDSSELSLFGNQLIIKSAADTDTVPRGDGVTDAETQFHLGLVVGHQMLAVIRERAIAFGEPVGDLLHRRLGTRFEHECFFVEDPNGVVWEVKSYGRK
jgi:extradiol dioxygenase family protein